MSHWKRLEGSWAKGGLGRETGEGGSQVSSKACGVPWYPGQCLPPSPQPDPLPFPKAQTIPFSTKEIAQRARDPAQPRTRAQSQMASEGGHPFFTNSVQFPSAVSPAVTNVQSNLIVHVDRVSRQLTRFHLCAARGLRRMLLPGELVLTFL